MVNRYRSLSGSLVDAEKKYHYSSDSDDDSDAPSLVSSRSDSGSYTPMLGHRHHSAPRPAKFAYHLPRRRFSRYFTLALFSTLALFIFYLVQARWAGDAALHRYSDGHGGANAAPEARPWEQFPFLKRYHGGIRTLVSRRELVPEYPADEDVEVQRLQDAVAAAKKTEDGGKAAEVLERVASRRRKREETAAAVDETTAATTAAAATTPDSTNALPHGKRFDPYPSYAEGGERAAFDPPVPCYLGNDSSKTAVPQLLAYPGVPQGFPEPVLGSYELLGLSDDVCFERHGRLGPYGYGYSKKYGGSGAGMEGDREGAEEVWAGEMELDYREVQWAQAQERCVAANAHRFRPLPEQNPNHFFTSMASGGPRKEAVSQPADAHEPLVTMRSAKQLLNRTAVIIRTWSDYKYDDEDLFYLRSLVNELSIQSGGEYVVHFLIHVKDDNLQIWADEETYQQVLDDALPAEFRGMGTLWSERQMGLIYGGVAESFYRDLPVHGAYRSTFMPVQYFAHMHPEYDFFWHWEMDVRYTGHFYHLFAQVSQWAKQQPRKGLWERNGRFYVPREHGSWEDFRQMVRVQTEHGTAAQQNMYAKLSADASKKHPLDTDSRRPETHVWGPMPPTGEDDSTDRPEDDPQPPTTYEKDNYAWGVGEEADLITFNPLFDPQHTNWVLGNDVTGYDTKAGHPPRRAAIITASRLSRRLLETMHRETALRRHTMFSEMWPASCALHHGYKAVYAPHPVYVDRAWPTSYLAAIYNNGRNGAAGGARTSVFSDERQHNFLGITWYYHDGFSANLWRRWLGFRVDNDGGEQWELANEGRMCLPAMLLHPVKQVDLVHEHGDGELVEEQEEQRMAVG